MPGTGPQACLLPKPVPGPVPFGQERGKKDQIHLFEGSIMRMSPEIKAHRLKKITGKGRCDEAQTGWR
jgi:hypothetical protein